MLQKCRKIVLFLVLSVSFISQIPISAQIVMIPKGNINFIDTVNNMPCYMGNFNKILREINTNAGSEIKKKLSGHDTFLVLVVDSTGKVNVSVKGTDSDIEAFEKLISNEINKLKWIPGILNGKPVNVKVFSSVYILDGRIVIQHNILKEVHGSAHSGTVYDQKTGKPLNNVKVTSIYDDYSAYSDENGHFTFYSEPGDKIEIRHINYEIIRFTTLDADTEYNLELGGEIYDLGRINLKIFNPARPLHRDYLCFYGDWPGNSSSTILVGDVDFFITRNAEFNDGNICFQKYASLHFVMPEAVIANDYKTEVKVQFTCNREGYVQDISFSGDMKYGLDDAITSFLTKMPRWKPALQADMAIDQRLQVTFIVGSNKYWKKYYRKKHRNH